jgi:single-stranded DNA-binding protein
VPIIGPGAGQHAARALCGQCGHFLKWLSKALFEKEPQPMGSMNVCSLVGRLARAPSVKWEGDGTQTCTFTLAIAERSYGPEPKAWTLFVPCTSYGRSAEACSTLQAQDMVAITGRLTWHKHKAKCGQEHSALVVKVQEVQVLQGAVCDG